MAGNCPAKPDQDTLLPLLRCPGFPGDPWVAPGLLVRSCPLNRLSLPGRGGYFLSLSLMYSLHIKRTWPEKSLSASIASFSISSAVSFSNLMLLTIVSLFKYSIFFSSHRIIYGF